MPSKSFGFLAKGAAASLLLVLGGCSGGEGVELNGKIFDYLGVSGAGAPSKDPKLAARAPLVLPPSLERLPDPNAEGREQGEGQLAEIVDPDRQKSTNRVALERQQAEYCKVNYDQAKARGDLEAETAKGPLGPCRTSILTALPKALKGGDPPAGQDQ